MMEFIAGLIVAYLLLRMTGGGYSAGGGVAAPEKPDSPPSLSRTPTPPTGGTGESS